MMKKRIFTPKVLIPFLVALLLITAARLGLPRFFSTAQATTGQPFALAPQAQTVPSDQLPPVLVATAPAEGEIWSGGAITFTFDQPLDPGSIVAFGVAPELAGTATVSGTALIFTPAVDPTGGERYTFTLDADAQGANGVALGSPVEVTLVAQAPLMVTSTQPGDGTTDVDTDSQIVVVFNRPVVELVGVAEQASLPQPLTIEPAVDGAGSWLNTSIYVFQPALGLAGATDYSVTVSDLTARDGSTLAEPVVFRFTTAAPIVTDVQPNMSPVAPESAFRITFSQPMDPASTATAVTLTNKEDGTAIVGETAWDEAQTTLTFTPTAQLAFGGNYTLRVDTSAQPASQQGTLREPYENDFTTVPLPAVDVVAPAAGATGVDPEMSVTIRFNTPMSRTQVLPYISITPTLTTTQVYSYYREYDNTAELSWFKEAQTTYTVTVGAEAMDLYANTLGEPYSFSFTTGDYSSFARLDVERFTHFSAYTETRVSTIYRNIEALEARLYQLPLEELFRLTGENQYEIWRNYTVPDPESNLIWERTYAPRVGLNVAAQQVISLTNANDELLAPGVYFLALDYPDRDTTVEIDQNVTPMQAVIILSNNNVIMKKSSQGNSLAWVTDLQSGQPIADLPVRFYHGGERKGEATTGTDGTALADLALDTMTGWYAALAVVGEPGDANFGLASSDWSQGIAPWDFNINGGYGVEEYRSLFYTDRPIYRPGQTVYWKGIIRRMVNDQYELPAATLPISITVRDDQGNAILDDTYTLNANGIVSDAITLAPEAVTGYYYLEARIILGPEQMTYGGVGFQVAAYRKPEFEITVTSDQPEYTNGDTATFGLQASYFSGGPLANAPVTWRLLSEPYTFNWADAPDGRYFSFTPYDPENTDYDPYRSAFYAGLIQEGTGTTDAQGNFSVDLPVDLQDLLQSQQWSFDVTVQSSTNQFVSGRTSVPVHKGEFYIGLSPRSYVATVDDESTVDLVTITPQGEAYPGVELEAIVYEFKWNSVYEQGANGAYNWQTSVERTPVFTTTVITDRDGMAALNWTPARGGQYQVVASGEDDAGNQISSAVFVWVSSKSFVPWPRENNDRIELVADKQSYAPGETAQILIPSPFTATVQALVTIERGGVMAEQVITLDGNSETLPVSITVDHIPDIFVSVIIVKGVDASNPTPAMRIGYVQLNVETAAKTLDVTVEPSATTVMPGDTVTYTLTVADHEGNPVPEAEVSVAVVDKAVLSLATDFNQSLVDFFYYLRPLGVSTGASLNINRDRLSQQLSEGAKGGGGGGGPGLAELREEFPDIAFWRAAFVSDENGQIIFSVELPDNLTTWRLAAKAVTADTLVGEAVNDVVATKALQIRPLLPRFFTAGDRSQIGAVVVNAGEGTMDDGRLTMAVEGATLDDDATEQSFTLDTGAQSRFDWPITIGSETAVVTFTFSAESTVDSDPAALTDAVRLAIPVRRYETPEVVGTAGVVPAAGVTEAVRVPAAATENGDLQVTVEPSLAAGMIDGLEYLAHFPYECNEQTVSRFLPNLFTVRALNELGIENADLERQLNYGLGVGVQRLVSRQNGDGGWGYWPTEESSPFITAYVLWGLVNAQGMDYTVPERTIANAIDYLDRQFKAPKDVTDQWLLNELAFMNFVLSEVGEGDPGRASTLYDARERLDLYGQALLAMTLDNLRQSSGQDLGENDDRVSTLLDNLYGAAQLSATGASWHEAEQDWWTLNTDIRTTAMVLAAFVRLQPDEPILPQAVRWLMSAREAGRWATTQENAWSIIALTDWMAATGELAGDYEWAVTLNGDEWGSGTVNADTIAEQTALRTAVAELLRDEANVIGLTRSNDSGELYYTTHLRYYLDALAIDARDRGIVVDRRFELDDATVQSAAVGDVISVTVTIVAPTDLYQALVEVPIPAGTEPIDPRLATTSVQYDQFGQLIPADAGKRWWWWTPTSVDVRDDRVALAATYLPAGTYEYTFQVQATVPGEYRVLPVTGQMLYFPEVWGRSAGALFTVTQ